MLMRRHGKVLRSYRGAAAQLADDMEIEELWSRIAEIVDRLFAYLFGLAFASLSVWFVAVMWNPVEDEEWKQFVY